MRDDYFNMFIEEFGEATQRVSVPAASIEKWRGKLPDQLLTYWQKEGWCAYAGGLLWIVDPEEYEDLIDEWLEDSRLDEIDSFHVIARSAFGELYACGEKTGISITVACPLQQIFALQKELEPKTKDELDISIRAFFLSSSPRRFNLGDESGQLLFDGALKSLGALSSNEMYGFEPALVLGGKALLENLAKVDLDVHLTILRQLGAPTVSISSFEIDKLISSQQ